MLADMSLVHLACSGAHSSSSDLGSLAIASNLFAQLVWLHSAREEAEKGRSGQQ